MSSKGAYTYFGVDFCGFTISSRNTTTTRVTKEAFSAKLKGRGFILGSISFDMFVLSAQFASGILRRLSRPL